ncbi:alpha/beta fold hydrolase [Sphingobacterium corticibacter]|uniref:Alpha/beta hydrolase n=1 Tax=Sphingobacterium corticibacter TaxID=2171749 RepID=A0A2T8HJ71_9SPHI|nr:alpha/beta hydrolase [Sphingobacterium corticibacter]PVH25498.1 alpha/beta hydrolase [Sphingobacterium corticibacter]
MAREIYIFSGLGADERVFQKLDFSGHKIAFIKWIAPQKDETIEQYATRLREQIPTTKPILIGLSFGGIMAVEVAKQIETEKVILIASAKTKHEIPIYYRVAGSLRLHKILPTALLKKSNAITNWLFGAESTSDKALLKQIVIDTDPLFLRWAIDKIALWKNQDEPHNLIHIHGTRDKILPYRFIKNVIKVKGGGHFMTLNKEDELNRILKQELMKESE